MSSALDSITGPATGAILTTYTVDFRFIDHWVLPILAKAGVRNVVVLADEQHAAEQIAFGEQSRAGSTYHVGFVQCPGAFHPKVIYLAGPDGQRACVSSANLTTSGQLRNLETGAVLESAEPEHQGALEDIRNFLLRLAVDQPAHVLEAMELVLGHGSERNDEPVSSIRFVHNLDRPIVEQLSSDPTSGIAPFARQSAVGRLSARKPFEVFVDGRDVASVADLVSLDLDLKPIRFEAESGVPRSQQLHGKALWNEGAGWCLVGSPNLTAPALLRPASEGNVEAAVIFEESGPFELPPYSVVPAPDLQDSTADSSADDVPPAEPLRMFSASLDDGLRVDRFGDGAIVEWANELGWQRLGEVVNGEVIIDGLDGVPSRLRAALGDGTYAYAIVHRVASLRVRRRSAGSAASQVIERVPLDIQGVRTLEGVLDDLYALDALVGEAQTKPQAEAGQTGERPVRSWLGDWRPARQHDEPRVPDLYMQAFRGDPDVLLALIRSALRLDVGESPSEVSAEDNEELEHEDIDVEAVVEETRAPLSSIELVQRYRTSLLKMLDRGAEKIGSMTNDVCRDLAFQTVVNSYARLGNFKIRLDHNDAHSMKYFQAADEDGTVEMPLLDPKQLIEPRLNIIDAYVRAAPELDVECRGTLMVHLGAAVLHRSALPPAKQRRLDDICFQIAPELLDSVEPEPGMIDGITPDLCRALLDEYVQRSGWEGVVEHALIEGWIAGELAMQPYPFVAGQAPFKDSHQSPAWKLIGYGSAAGYQDNDPFAVSVTNTDDKGPFTQHILKVEPTGRGIKGDRIHEVLRRRRDSKWMTRTLSGYNLRDGERLLEIVGVRRVLEGLACTDFEESDWAPPAAREFYQARKNVPVLEERQ